MFPHKSQKGLVDFQVEVSLFCDCVSPNKKKLAIISSAYSWLGASAIFCTPMNSCEIEIPTYPLKRLRYLWR